MSTFECCQFCYYYLKTTIMINTCIIFWNFQGLTRRHLELIDFVIQQKIDISLHNETHLSGQSSIKIAHYYIYTSNRYQVPGQQPMAALQSSYTKCTLISQ